MRTTMTHLTKSLLVGLYVGSVIAASPTINLGYARYQGILVQDSITNQTNTNFLGVRYAAPATGAARFRAARPPAFTPGVQIANTQPPGCFAASMGTAPSSPFRESSLGSGVDINGGEMMRTDAMATVSEDCLFLNVFVPGNMGSEQKLPVIVWIHAGGYIAGAASQLTGNDILRESAGGVMLVIIQYRLGLFGFLAGQKVKDGGVLNAGLLDQQFALQWVQEHISKFGGDPSRVTIWGQSAGAGSVIQHVVANDGRTRPKLFRAAMTSSTFLPSQYAFNDRIPELIFSEVLAQTNCTSVKDSLDCLRALDSNMLQAANVAISNSGFFGTFTFVPVVDGTFITARPTQLLREGKINTRFIQSFTNPFEGTSFVDQSMANTFQISEYISQLFPDLDGGAVKTATALYAGLGANIFQANAIMGETIFICPTQFLMRAFGKKAFKGEFAIPPGTHANDVGFYFPSISPGGVPSFPNKDFDRAFSQSFINFALSLDPNVKFDPTNVTPLWNPWEGSNEMLFNKTEANETVICEITTSSSLLERCAFWESISAQTAQ